MRIRTGLSGSLLVLALAATGCGSDEPDEESNDPSSAASSDQGAGATTEVCTLLAPADLEAEFGSEFDGGEPTHEEGTGADQCVWTSTAAGSAETFSFTVLTQDGLAGELDASGMTVGELFEQTKLAYPNAEPLDLGDESYLSVKEVQVLAGDTWYSLSFHGTSGTAVEGLKELAAQVLG
jgi:hypothetical protein